MKDFMKRHPIISLLMLDVVVEGILNGIRIIKGDSIDESSDENEDDSK